MIIFKTKLKSFSFFLLFTISSFALAGLNYCGNKKQPETNRLHSAKLNVNVCDIISKQDIEQIFHITIDKVRNTVQNSDENKQKFVSQCAYEVTGNDYKSVSIYLSYFTGATNPKTFDELVKSNTHLLNGNDPEENKMADELKNSFLSGTKINDLGDIGVWHNWSGVPSLLLYFNDHYKMIINLIEFDFNNETLKQVKGLAKEVMSKI